VKFLHRQGFDKCWTVLRRYDEEAVGLALIGGYLGEELVVGNAGVGWHLNARMRQFVRTVAFNYENLSASVLK
jgi:hypothetical protein